MPGVEEQENGEKASKAAYLMVKVTINTINTIAFTLIFNIINITIKTVIFISHIILITIPIPNIIATTTYQGSIGEDLSSQEEFTTALR